MNDKRCVTILTGLPSRQDKEFCNAIYNHGDWYFTQNPDGSVHGIHQLSPMKDDERVPNVDQ